MVPYVEVFGRMISMYAVCILAGLVLGIWTALWRAKLFCCKKEDALFASFYGILGLAAGGKLLYLLTELPWLVDNWKQVMENPAIWSGLMSGGFVFYGGLFGAVGGICLYAKQYHLKVRMLLEVLVPVVPLVHAFGRVGCFCAGCCYGIPLKPPWGVYFVQSLSAPHDQSFFPVQLLEAACNLALFFLLMCRYAKRRTNGEAACCYILSYSILRFGLEFLRADAQRGIWGGLSTSQWISLMAIILTLLLAWFKKRRALS